MKRLLFCLLCLALSTIALAQTVIKVPTSDHTIHVESFGTGEPLLIINGGPGMNSQGFRPLARTLGRTHRAIIYDQRATGKSVLENADTNNVTLDLMVADIDAIRTHLKIKKWAVLGQSFGGSCGDAPGNKYFDPAILHNNTFIKTKGYCTDLFFDQAMK